MVGISWIAEVPALRDSKPVSSPHCLSEDWDLEHGWLQENPGSSRGFLRLVVEKGSVSSGRSSTLIPECYSQDVGNRTQNTEFFFAEDIDSAFVTVSSAREIRLRTYSLGFLLAPLSWEIALIQSMDLLVLHTSASSQCCYTLTNPSETDRVELTA